MLCIPIEGKTITEINKKLQDLHAGVGMVEIQADRLEYSERSNLSFLQLPPGVESVLTLRRRQEGGSWAGSESERIRILHSLRRQGIFSYVLMEEDCREADRSSRSVLLSCATSFPDSLPETTGLVKIMWNPRSGKEFFQIVRSLMRTDTSRLILEASGPYGLSLTAMAPVLGGFRVCWHPSLQISPEDFLCQYRYNPQMGTDTEVFGIIGYPLEHSFSPAFHNAIFHQQKMNALYLPLPSDEIAPVIDLISFLKVRGFSVTVPHKRAIVPYLFSQSESVRVCGACNTVIRDREGMLHGENTDLAGFLYPLETHLQKGLTLVIIGAGGAARAVVGGLYKKPLKLWILNRSPEKSQTLCEEFQEAGESTIHHGPLQKLSELPVPDIIIQATSVGLHETDPIPFYSFRGSEIVYDLIYNPPETVLLRRAKKAGCVIINGEQMFRRQAELQSKLFLGSIPPD